MARFAWDVNKSNTYTFYTFRMARFVLPSMKQIKLSRYVLACGLASTLLWLGCAAQKISNTSARKALEQAGFEPEVVQAFINRQLLEPEVTQRMLDTQNPSVYFILASNPNLDGGLLEPIVHHEITEIRAEVAQHPQLTDVQIEQLLGDDARSVYCNLARNPDVPEAILTRLREERGTDLIHFAYNPSCPKTIRAEILDSGDAKAIQWVKTNDEARKIMQAKEERLTRIAGVRKN
ncbi:MAG: hypothetical protein ACI9TH_001302 [Kiritimatiellia bacterium]